jgi:hypothetical protein
MEGKLSFLRTAFHLNEIYTTSEFEVDTSKSLRKTCQTRNKNVKNNVFVLFVCFILRLFPTIFQTNVLPGRENCARYDQM